MNATEIFNLPWGRNFETGIKTDACTNHEDEETKQLTLKNKLDYVQLKI